MGLGDLLEEYTRRIRALEERVDFQERLDIPASPWVGGESAARPSAPDDYQMFFDTDLGIPIWWDGSGWVDATGAGV